MTDELTRFSPGVPAVLMLLFAFIGSASHWLRLKNEAVLLPAVGSVFGLTHRKRDLNFVVDIPHQVLPEQGCLRQTDDVFAGEVAGHHLRFAEIRTGRNNSSPTHGANTVFKGLVIDLSLAGQSLPLLVVNKHYVKQGQESGIATVGLALCESHSHFGAEYGLWALGQEREGERRDFLRRIVELGPNIFGTRAFLVSALLRDQRLWVSLSYRRNLFSASGLFAGQKRMMADLRQAAKEIGLVLRFATELLKAERGLSGPALQVAS
ncbi:hypothetical protein HOY34_19505 [Xinfangfangia sp. D13-10-4-6]|uniref:hypothetical protein n=1 Tax=Pseudogemmobacter hezensis TaxID=2737662 RepID=UPI001557826D|nr:hypothetical protein [Pseudogemmobacter hezensis]NPD17376.1 hypothetical protein [Pseudogemmobacter hezensis]